MWIDDYDQDNSGDLCKQLVCQEIRNLTKSMDADNRNQRIFKNKNKIKKKRKKKKEKRS